MEPTADIQSEYEGLVEFLYQCPIAISRIRNDGTVEMMNPTGTQLFMPLSPGGEIPNLFQVLDRYAPELRRLSENGPPRGTLCENYRVRTDAPGPGGLQLVLSVSMLRLNKEQMMVVISDSSRQAALEQTAEDSRVRFQTVLDGLLGEMLGYAVLPIGLSGQVEQWSRPAEHLLGLSANAAVGQPLDFLIGPKDVVSDLLNRARQGERSRGEVTLRHGSGRGAPAQCSLIPISADGKRPLAFLCMLHGLS